MVLHLLHTILLNKCLPLVVILVRVSILLMSRDWEQLRNHEWDVPETILSIPESYICQIAMAGKHVLTFR